MQLSDANKHKSPEQLRREMLELKIKTVKADHAPGVVKYFSYQKNTENIQSPLHLVEYHRHKLKPQYSFSRTLQKVEIEPTVQIDEIKEERWSILSKNCQNLLHKSRVSLGKLNQSQILDPVAKTISPNKFLTRRQSIELRANNIKSPVSIASPLTTQQLSPNQQDNHFAKFKKFYKKIGIPKIEEQTYGHHYFKRLEKAQLKKMFQMTSVNQSQFVTPKSSTLQQYHVVLPQKKQRFQYAQQLETLCYNAHNFQEELKKDESANYGNLSQKVSFIQSEFKKYHQMLNNEQESLDEIK